MRFRRRFAILLLVPAWFALTVLAPHLFPALSQPKEMEPKAKSPQESLKCIKPRPGFTVDLVAHEPLVMDPVAFAWGPDGKFWVVEMGDYPLGVDGKNKHGGNIKYLEDTDGDGKYDKATLFLKNLGYPTGVLPWKKGVLVTCAPDIFYAEDSDGDGKADVKTVLFTGFKEGNQQHRVNSLVWGLDNWIHVANGDSGGMVKSLKTGQTINLSGRDLRIKPDEGLIEAQTGQTQFGRAKDNWDNWFGNNNSNPMFHFVLADHYLKRNPHYAPPSPKVQVSVKPGASPVFPISPPLPRFNNPNSVNHFTSACSTIVYRDDLFYGGAGFLPANEPANEPGRQEACPTWVFISEPVHNLIHREIMQPKGVTFTSQRAPDEQQSEFLASSDNWFRPAMIQTGPDGALWIADMYRYVIEHPEWIPKEWQQKLDLRAGHDLGRIYKTYPAGKKPRAIPRLDKLDTSGLVAALDSPSGWQRDLAQMMLIHKNDVVAVPLLEKMVKGSKRPLARVHALCTLDGMKALGAELLKQALKDEHPGVRKHAVRLSEPFLVDSFNLGHKLTSVALGQEILKRVNDPDIHVRMQMAYTLGTWQDPKVGKALGELALHDGSDPFFLAAVMSSITKENLPPMLLAVLSGGKESVVSGPLVQSLVEIAQRQGNVKATASLLAAIGKMEKGSFSPWQFSALAGLLDSLDANKNSLAKWQSQGDEELKAAVKSLAMLFEEARGLASNPKTPEAQRLLAIKLLGRGPTRQKEDVELLAQFLTPQTIGPVQQAAVTTLGKLREPEVPSLLLKGWKSYSPALRFQVLEVLLSRPNGAKIVLTALEKKQLLPMEVDLVHQQRLLGHKSDAISFAAAKAFDGTINSDRGKVVAAYKLALDTKGDAVKGKVLFEKNCATCHHLGGIGQKVGPDLSSLSSKSGAYFLHAILDPNAAVEARYLNYTVITKNGVTHAGLLASETATSITLALPDGKQQTILRTDLDELVSSGKSAMPEGLEKDITPAQMADVLAFLRANQLNPNRKEFSGNTPATIQPNPKNGSLLLAASDAEIYGPSLVFEAPYLNLGYWSSTDDHAIWTVELKKPGKYAVWFDWAMSPNAAGNSFVLEAGANQLTGKVNSTGSWDTYKQAQIGTLSLPSGQSRITLRPLGAIHGALIDLKSIKLVPMGE